MDIRVRLPHEWAARPYQQRLWDYLFAGGKRALAVWHRRAGKDDVALHHTAIAAHKRIGNYWHCMPEYLQGRKAIWNAINPHTGKRRIDEAFPAVLRESTNDTGMFIRFKNQSTWQIIGSDRYDATVGSSVAGIVYSEYALSNPAAWAYHKPILEENKGWALFISTPRGRNHMFEMARHARQTPGWFYEMLTVNDTGAMDAAAQAEAIAEYSSLYGTDIGQAQFRQEYLCDFQAALLGAFYALEMVDVRNQQRVRDDVVALPDRPVHRVWDLGVRHSTVIWMFQAVGAQLRVLDCYSSSGVGIEHYAGAIERLFEERGWVHGTDYVPHDAKVKEFGTGRTRVETMTRLGLAPMLIRDASVEDGINACRRMLPLCVFHSRCESGLAALEQYRREWDEEKKCFRSSALEDWTADYADAARYMALAWQPAPLRAVKVPMLEGWRIPPPPEPQRGRIRL